MNAPPITTYFKHGLSSLVYQVFLSKGESRMICPDGNTFFLSQREMEDVVETDLLKNGSQLVVPVLPSLQDFES
jgi:hypothetical protein